MAIERLLSILPAAEKLWLYLGIDPRFCWAGIRLPTERLVGHAHQFHAPGLVYATVGFMDAASLARVRAGGAPRSLWQPVRRNGSFPAWLDALATQAEAAALPEGDAS